MSMLCFQAHAHCNVPEYMYSVHAQGFVNRSAVHVVSHQQVCVHMCMYRYTHVYISVHMYVFMFMFCMYTGI